MAVQQPTSLRISTIATPSILVIQEGQDYLLGEDVQLPYKLVRNLGHGHSANVEMVKDVNTGSVFARKVFPVYGSRTEARRIFDNEIKIIRRLAPHHHIIRIFATYVGKREVGLILHPVADSGDLYTFLQDFKEAKVSYLEQSERAKILESSFGCLASGLAFMHRQMIRHKDIKPQNILVHKGSLIYTDFGYSLDHSAIGGSTTTGIPNAFTRKYCAPEVSDHGPRNSKSDIFSLGCIFLDILLVLREELISPDPSKSYQEILENRQLRSSLQGLNRLGIFTYNMLLPQSEKRPSAEDITSELEKYEPDRFCAQCRSDVRIKPQQMLDTLVPPVFTDPLPPGSIPSDQKTPHRVSDNPSDVSQNYAKNDEFPDPCPDLLDLNPYPTHWRSRSPADGNIYYSKAPWSNVNSANPNHVSNDSLTPRASKPRINETPHKPYICNIRNCPRKVKGFTTRNDLERHQKSIHKIGTSYKCASEDCINRNKIWSRLDNFRQHIHKLHRDEDEEELIRRSGYRSWFGSSF